MVATLQLVLLTLSLLQIRQGLPNRRLQVKFHLQVHQLFPIHFLESQASTFHKEAHCHSLYHLFFLWEGFGIIQSWFIRRIIIYVSGMSFINPTTVMTVFV